MSRLRKGLVSILVVTGALAGVSPSARAQMCKLPGSPGSPSCSIDSASQSNTGPTAAGNPIDITSGNKYQREVDVAGIGASPLAFVRHYNSQADRDGAFGRGWSHTYDTRLTRRQSHRLVLSDIADKTDDRQIEVTQGDGRVIRFVPYAAEKGGVQRYVSKPAGFGLIEERTQEVERLRPAAAQTNSLLSTAPGAGVWRWRWPSGRTIEFDGRGLLSEIIEQDGSRLRATFDRQRRLTRVVDAQSRSLTLKYWDDAAERLDRYETKTGTSQGGAFRGRLHQITLPDGGIILYGYDAQGELSHVRYADGTVKHYEYVTAADTRLLSKIIDRGGALAALFEYDAKGYAVHSTHPDHVGEVNLQYQWPPHAGDIGTTWVTTHDGERTEYRWRTDQYGASGHIIEARGPGCGTCAPSNVRYEVNAQGTESASIRLDSHGSPVERDLRVNDDLGRTTHIERARFIDRKLQTPDWTEDFDYSGDEFSPSRVRTPSVVAGGVHEVDYTYNLSGQPTEMREFGWDPVGATPLDPWTANPTAIERRVRLTYDASGRLRRIEGPRTDVKDAILLDYDALGRLQRTRYANGSVQEVAAYDAYGLPKRIRQSGLPEIELTNDASGRPIKIAEVGIDSPRSVQYSYDERGRLREITARDGRKLRVNYDAANRSTSYDDEDTGIGQAVNYADDTQPGERQILDRNGRVLRTIAYSYDARHRLTAERDSEGRTLAEYGYDGDASKPNRLVDSVGLQTLLSYDWRGRLVSERSPDGGSTELRYDRADRIVQFNAANGAVTRYQYDDFGRRVREDSSDRGRTRFFYDLAGNRTAKVDARGVVVRYGYDATDRLIRIQSGTDTTRLEYANGRLTKIVAAWGEERYGYDARGRLVEHARIIDSHQFTTAYRYDSLGRMTEKHLPDGQVLNYHYGTLGALQAITHSTWTGESVLIGTLEGSAPQEGGGETGLQFGNGLFTRASLDEATGRVLALNTAGVEDLEYRYDAVGKIAAVDVGSKHYRYSYDSLGRLTGADSASVHLAYGYDANGNRISSSDAGGTTAYRYAGASNRLSQVGENTYQYDESGNAVAVGGRRYEYDADGRPTKFFIKDVLKAEYAYNTWGQRIKKVVHSGTDAHATYYLFDHDQLSAEIQNGGKLIQQYVYVQHVPVASLVGRDAYFIHTDQLGAPRAVTDASRRVAWRADYAPFGEAMIDEDPDHRGQRFTLNLRFPGQYSDEETGTFYNYYRDYDPKLGRYLQSDPVGLDGGTNTYAYAAGDPISTRDIFGTQAPQPPWLLGIMVHANMAGQLRVKGGGWGGGDGRNGTWLGGAYPDAYYAPNGNAAAGAAESPSLKGDIWELKPISWAAGPNRALAVGQVNGYRGAAQRGCWGVGSSSFLVAQLTPAFIPWNGGWTTANFLTDPERASNGSDSTGLIFYSTQQGLKVPVAPPVYVPVPVRENTKQPSIENGLNELLPVLKKVGMAILTALAWIALAAAVIIALLAAALAIGAEAAVAAIVLVIGIAIDTIASGKQSAAATLGQIFGRSPSA
jgi:RHS repeat-associated protein